jgi:hypothetical protein
MDGLGLYKEGITFTTHSTLRKAWWGLPNIKQQSYLIGVVAPSTPPSSERGTRSHLKCNPQLKPPRTTGDAL